MGIKSDYDDYYDGNYDNEEIFGKNATDSTRLQFREHDYEMQDYEDDFGNVVISEEECATSNGIMQNLAISKKLKIKRWSKCSQRDFKKYIQKNGGVNFCIFLTQKPSLMRDSKDDSIWKTWSGYRLLHPSSMKPEGK